MRHKKPAIDPDELGKRLGRAIAERRKAMKLTQDDVAGLVEVDAETISRFERGTSVPSLQRLFVIANALGAGVGELLTETSALSGDRAETLAAMLKGMKAADQQLLMDIAGLMAKR